MNSLTALPEYDGHKYVLRFQEPQSQLVGYIAIHRSDALRPAFGATRLWHYETEEEALADVLRLSKGMSKKSALAGLRYGGAKAVIIEPKGAYNRNRLLKAYAHVVNDLHGQFITGTDAGMTRDDVIEMRKYSRYFVGVNVDPTNYTVLGILSAIKTTLKFLYQDGSLQQRSFAIQGAGKIGGELIRLLYPQTKAIYVSEIDKTKVSTLKDRYPEIQFCEPDDIHKMPVDIFSPCALAYAINRKTVAEIQSKAVVGGANNQLENTTLADELRLRGILYAPDYVVNAGGLISVASEYESHHLSPPILEEKIGKISSLLEQLFRESSTLRASTVAIAEQIAHQQINSFEPYRYN